MAAGSWRRIASGGPFGTRYICSMRKTGRLKKEIPLAPRRVTGGNLLIAGGQLLIATGSELVALGQNGGRPGTEEEKAR